MTINRLHLKSLDTHTHICLDEVSDYFIPRRKKKDSTITITSRDKLRITNLSTSTNELKQLTQLSNRALFYICIIIEKPPLTTQDTFFDRFLSSCKLQPLLSRLHNQSDSLLLSSSLVFMDSHISFQPWLINCGCL